MDARDFSDWMNWLSQAKMYGPPFTPERIAEIGQSARKRSLAEELAAWTTDAWAIAKSDYNEQTETWRFGALQFSENYNDYLEMLPPSRAVDRFELSEGHSTVAGSPDLGVPFPQHYAEKANAFLASLIPDT